MYLSKLTLAPRNPRVLHLPTLKNSHTWVTTRAPVQTEEQKKQGLVQSFLSYFGLNGTNVQPTQAIEEKEDTVPETEAKENEVVAEEKPSPFVFHWNIPANAPVARLEFQSSAGVVLSNHVGFTDELNELFDAPQNASPLEIPVIKEERYISNGYSDFIQSKIEAAESSLEESERNFQHVHAKVKLNEFVKWYIENYMEETKECYYKFSESTPKYMMRKPYKDLYSDSSYKMCAMLVAIFGGYIFKSFGDNDICNNVKMPEEFNIIFEKLTPHHIYGKIIMSIPSPYYTVKWQSSFIPYFNILRTLRQNEPDGFNGSWEILAFKLTVRYMFEILSMRLGKQHLYPDYMSDVIDLFINICLTKSESSGGVQSSELYTTFNKMIDDVFLNGDPRLVNICSTIITPYMNSKVFANELKTKGIQSVRKAAGIFYTGIELATAESRKKVKVNKEEPKPQDVFEIGTWKYIYGSGDYLELGEKMAGFDYKLLKEKPVVEAAPKITSLRSLTGKDVKVSAPVLSQDI